MEALLCPNLPSRRRLAGLASGRQHAACKGNRQSVCRHLVAARGRAVVLLVVALPTGSLDRPRQSGGRAVVACRRRHGERILRGLDHPAVSAARCRRERWTDHRGTDAGIARSSTASVCSACRRPALELRRSSARWPFSAGTVAIVVGQSGAGGSPLGVQARVDPVGAVGRRGSPRPGRGERALEERTSVRRCRSE